jgi:protein O-GlcNAc transferase
VNSDGKIDAELLERAIDLHKAGRLAEARALYEQLLAREPHHPDALYYLGILRSQLGDQTAAVEMLRRAIALRPTVARYHNDLANALKAAGQHEQAILTYRRAIELDPCNAFAFANLGSLCLQMQSLDEAIFNYRAAIELIRRQSLVKPDRNLARMLNDLAVALAQGGWLDESLAELNAAIAADPDYPDVYNNLGSVFSQQGRLTDAIGAFDEAIRRNPRFHEPYNNLGISLTRLGRGEEAVAAYRKAIDLSAQNAKAHINLAQTLIGLGELDQAIEMSKKAIELAPNSSAAYQALASALREAARLDESLLAFDRAIELDPADASALSGRIFVRHFHSGSDSSALLRDHRLWNERHAQPLQKQIIAHTNIPIPDRPLRIGYVSPDFTNHVLAFLILPLFEHHDRSQFQLHFYSDVASPTPVTERFKNCGGKWTPIVGLSHDQVAKMIRQDQIDILVDLTMHMRDNRLLVFARKPAPVQATWIAYPGSTGLSAIDYRFTDPHLDPPGRFDDLYSEKSVRLPDTFWCYDPMTDSPAVNDLPAAANGYITFGCLNNFCKLNAATLQLWAKLLHAVPNSRLLLLSPTGSSRQWVERILEECAIPPNRIEHVSRRPRPQYLELFHRIDISLDTLPYNGHTTSLDSLWMGVPVITMEGETVVGRAGVSELTNLGLVEFIARDAEEYIKCARTLALDSPKLKELRLTLRSKMRQSPLMDGQRFARNFETAYRQIWRRWCESRAGGLDKR